MVCGFEIAVPILVFATAVCGAIAGASEILPFVKKVSSNGILHSIYHLLSKKDKCNKEDIEDIIEDAEELVEDVVELVEEVKKQIDK